MNGVLSSGNYLYESLIKNSINKNTEKIIVSPQLLLFDIPYITLPMEKILIKSNIERKISSVNDFKSEIIDKVNLLGIKKDSNI